MIWLSVVLIYTYIIKHKMAYIMGYINQFMIYFHTKETPVVIYE